MEWVDGYQSERERAVSYQAVVFRPKHELMVAPIQFMFALLAHYKVSQKMLTLKDNTLFEKQEEKMSHVKQEATEGVITSGQSDFCMINYLEAAGKNTNREEYTIFDSVFVGRAKGLQSQVLFAFGNAMNETRRKGRNRGQRSMLVGSAPGMKPMSSFWNSVR